MPINYWGVFVVLWFCSFYVHCILLYRSVQVRRTPRVGHRTDCRWLHHRRWTSSGRSRVRRQDVSYNPLIPRSVSLCCSLSVLSSAVDLLCIGCSFLVLINLLSPRTISRVPSPRGARLVFNLSHHGHISACRVQTSLITSASLSAV